MSLLYDVCPLTLHDSCCKERNFNLNIVLLMTNISLKIHKSTDHNNVLLPSNDERNVFKIKIGIIAILELDSI